MTAAIIIRASRPNYRYVVRDFLTSLRHFNHLIHHRFDLYISADPKMEPLNPELYLDDNTSAEFRRVRYILNTHRQELVTRVVAETDTSQDMAHTLFLQEPYGYQINSALVYALADGHSLALHFDDDQGFAAPVQRPGKDLTWIYMDVFGWHLLGHLDNASVTTGPVAGWVSPVPDQLLSIAPQDLRLQLGRLFQGAHEFITSQTFLKSPQRLVIEADLNHQSLRSLTPNSAWISPANLGINLRSSFPAFFNPPGARGEDAFFAMSFPAAFRVLTIPAFVFHDPFLIQPEIYSGGFPKELRAVPFSRAVLERFSGVVLGWLRYMPLYLRIRRARSSHDFAGEIEKRRRMIGAISARLCDVLEYPEFARMGACFESYCQRVEKDHEDWLAVNAHWRQQVLPWAQSFRTLGSLSLG